MTVDEFIKIVESAYKKQFPRGEIRTRFKASGFGGGITFYFGVQNKSDWFNNIWDNDPAASIVMIRGDFDGDQMPEKVEADLIRGKSLLIAPASDSHMAYDSVKIGWRKKSGSPEQIARHMAAYFAKMRQTVENNRGKLKHKVAKGVSDRGTAAILSKILGYKVSAGMGGKYPIYLIGNPNKVIIEKDNKFYFMTESSGKEKLKEIKVARSIRKGNTMDKQDRKKIAVELVLAAKDLMGTAEEKNYDYYLSKWQKTNESIAKSVRDLSAFLQDKGVNDLLESDTTIGDFHDRNLEPILKKLHKVQSALVDYDHEVKKAVRWRKRNMTAAWPSKVKEGGLRAAMGLSTDKSLEDQSSPSAVISFFKKADEKGRGMVMFAVNSNKDSTFWKKVKAGI